MSDASTKDKKQTTRDPEKQSRVTMKKSDYFALILLPFSGKIKLYLYEKANILQFYSLSLPSNSDHS